MEGRRRPHFLQDNLGFHTTSYGPFILRSAFQPIFSQDAGGRLTIEAFEALIRASSNGQPVSPYHFFSMVEPEDAVAIDTVCRELHILNMGVLGRRKASLFVNFNPALFDAVADIEAEIDRMVEVTLSAGLRPSRIVCEITEQGSGDKTVLDRLVSGLRARRFKIAVDDFGADDSDIQRVTDLNPDILKFDAEWVRRFTETSAGMALLKLSVQQFIERGITVLFEGLEEEHQVAFCNTIGVQLMQGYALARPEIVPTTFSERFPEIDRQAEWAAAAETDGGTVSGPAPMPSPHLPSSSDRAATGAPVATAAPAPAFGRRVAAFGKRTR
jgi:EAL domain-containing protein (putative c-di-GMP-specific phosphodiesterase class I)